MGEISNLVFISCFSITSVLRIPSRVFPSTKLFFYHNHTSYVRICWVRRFFPLFHPQGFVISRCPALRLIDLQLCQENCPKSPSLTAFRSTEFPGIDLFLRLHNFARTFFLFIRLQRTRSYLYACAFSFISAFKELGCTWTENHSASVFFICLQRARSYVYAYIFFFSSVSFTFKGPLDFTRQRLFFLPHYCLHSSIKELGSLPS